MPTSAASAKTGADGVFTSQLAVLAGEIEALLDRLLRPPPDSEIQPPARLLEAMRYAALGGGKRLRPFLLVETARLFDVGPAAALPAAAAIECIHTYSLIHDDLPAMDNDALRRGRPTLHMAFDEATAILAGDALLTLAFDLLARVETHPDAAVRVRLIAELGCAAGAAGMVGGQLLDLAAEGRFATAPRPGEADIARIDSLKTGALLRAACRMGAIIGNAPPDAGTAIDRYASALGQAFQIADDLLDAEGDPATVGKATGKDAAAGKATLVTLLGPQGARARLAALTAEAEAALAGFGDAASSLRAAAHFIAARRA
ncbi:MAG TPA: farnesyl diphosphate synthase [Xanthobacteraceae bacterium]|nr:farnesyl diphosphate synthase [Xanthobacteraceae bacterium]